MVRRGCALVLMMVGCLYCAAASADEVRTRVVVFDLRAQGVEEALASTMTDVFLYEVSRFPELVVLGDEDIRATLQHNAVKYQLGCDDNCWIQMAQAVDSDYLVHGSLGMVASTPNLTLTLLDIRKAEVVKRHIQELVGDSESVFAAVRVAARQLLGPILDTTSEVEEENFGLPMLERLRSAYKPRKWKFYGHMGGGIMGGRFEEVDYSSAMGTIALGADMSLDQSVFLGLEIGLVGEGDGKRSIALYKDPDTGEVSTMPYSSDSKLGAAYYLVKGGVRKESGIILPYFALGIGQAQMTLSMSDAEAMDENVEAATIVREGGDSPAILLAMSSGTELILADWLGVSVDFRMFAYLNWLTYRYYPEGRRDQAQETEVEGAFATIYGAQITTSVHFQF